MNINSSFKTNLSKNLYLIRGSAIVLVVVGHVIGYDITYGMRQVYNSNLYFLGWLCDLINTFHMPTFFIASGIAFAAFSSKDISYQKFFTSKIQKLLIPLIVWCPPYFILQSLSKSKSFSFLDVIKAVIQPYEIFWFLHVLIFTTIFAFIYFKQFKSVPAYICLSVALFAATQLLNQPEIKTYFYWNIFYAFGILITQNLYKIESLILKNNYIIQQILLPLLCLGVMIMAQYFISQETHISELRLINGITGFIFMYLISMQLTTNLEKPISHKQTLAKFVELFAYLGKVSIAIYLFHGYFTGFTKATLLKLWGLPNPGLYFILVSLMGILGPILIYEALKDRSKTFMYSIGGYK